MQKQETKSNIMYVLLILAILSVVNPSNASTLWEIGKPDNSSDEFALNNGIIITSIRPSRDGKAIMIRLFNTDENSSVADIRWNEKPKSLWFSNTMEHEIMQVDKTITMESHSIITLRVVL